MIHKIKALYDDGKGLSKRAIARKFGLSRNTVKKYLGMSEKEIESRQADPSRVKKLDEHQAYIVHLLQEFPGLSAVKVLRKLKEKHPALGVSDRSARRYIRSLKETHALKQKRYYEPVLDMVPGVQCQIDGGELRGLRVGGVEITLYFVIFVLSYSRMIYVGLSRTPVNTDRFIQMHDEAFRYFGGMPEECVYDQAKLVVLHEQYRELELNQAFHAYATTAGFRIHACEGYDPESKGKVESGVKYVKNNALYGEQFESWPALEQYLQQWLNETANMRIHGTTGEQPKARYDRDERAKMKAYLSPEYCQQNPSLPKHTRKVDKTGLISWKAIKYSVPLLWQQSKIGVTEEQGELLIIDLASGDEIARHRLSYDKGAIIKNRDHYRDKAQRIKTLEREIVEQLGEPHGAHLCALLKKTNGNIYKDQLAGLKGLLKQSGMPPPLLQYLCDRSSLATSEIRDLLAIYQTHPERFKVLPEPPGQQAKTTSNSLRHYSQIAEEAPYDHLH